VVVSRKGGNEEAMVAKLFNFIGLTDIFEVLFTEILFTGGNKEEKGFTMLVLGFCVIRGEKGEIAKQKKEVKDHDAKYEPKEWERRSL
jgi:uncharacterized RDD family membrane protein YckC